MNILEQLAAAAADRVQQQKQIISEEEMKERALSLPRKDHRFTKALAADGLTFICECKKASPSRGLIAPAYNAGMVAEGYLQAGADCISVLSEPKWFLGSDDDVRAAVRTGLPVLRKDFTVDPYMIWQARVLGADAVLLIASLLEEEEVRQMLQICERLGLDALCEARTEEEIRMLVSAGAKIIGVNNRNLKDFSMDRSRAAALRQLVPEGVLFVVESGVRSREDTEQAEAIQADGVLIGEALMKAQNPAGKLQELRGLAHE